MSEQHERWMAEDAVLAEQMGAAREALAADDMDRLAEAALQVHGLHRNDAELLLADMLTGLSVSQRGRLADALVRAYESAAGDSLIRFDVFPLVALVCGLPDSGSLIVARRKLLEAFTRDHSVWFFDWMADMAEIEIAAGRPLPPAVIALLRRSALLRSGRSGPFARVARLLTEPVLNVGEEWADRVLADLPVLPPPWRGLLSHAATATMARPSAAWEKSGRELLGSLDADAVRTTILSWLTLIGRPRTLPLEGGADFNDVCDPYNDNALRGLAWLLSFLPPHPDIARGLGAVAETSLRTVVGRRPRNPKVANAAVIALSRIDGDAALAELARLAATVTYNGTLKLLDEGLQARAAAMGLSREDIEELAVPTCGLTGHGRAVRQFGRAGTAELLVCGKRTALTWRNGAGTVVRSIPAVIRREHQEELKELKVAVKDIDKLLSAQAGRLDRQFLARRSWTYAAWRERCLDHPLVGTLARRLLWTVDGQACGFADGELRTVTGSPVAGGSTVQLWHPTGREPAEVFAWRDWLERQGVTQPFKQAHREVYLLTDAERDTGSYSNRFAAHILRQHQFHSLAALRGWHNKLRVDADSGYPPATRELPQWGLRAEFWIEGTDATESGSYLLLHTDQVRFYPITAPPNYANDAFRIPYQMVLGPGQEPVQPLPLTQIPELVLSEVFRDLDLFVGVASIGNDSTWQDGGPYERYREYWGSYSFGELSQAAEIRRELLRRLLPRLEIGGQCTIEGRFLHVKGTKHTYKIHLGSGNILIAPQNRYLCIVPRRGADPDVGYLPFEGDEVLSLIVSKAMLLARDTQITDPSIISQLRERPATS
jgi:Domain of unknown function (DUF4132)